MLVTCLKVRQVIVAENITSISLASLAFMDILIRIIGPLKQTFKNEIINQPNYLRFKDNLNTILNGLS